jgi:hypothetical protein
MKMTLKIPFERVREAKRKLTEARKTRFLRRSIMAENERKQKRDSVYTLRKKMEAGEKMKKSNEV